MDKVAPMLRKLGYDPHGNPPNYGTPEKTVQDVSRNSILWQFCSSASHVRNKRCYYFQIYGGTNLNVKVQIIIFEKNEKQSECDRSVLASSNDEVIVRSLSINSILDCIIFLIFFLPHVPSPSVMASIPQNTKDIKKNQDFWEEKAHEVKGMETPVKTGRPNR